LKDAGCGGAHDHLRSCRDDAKGADRYSAAAGRRRWTWPTWRHWSLSAIQRHARGRPLGLRLRGASHDRSPRQHVPRRSPPARRFGSPGRAIMMTGRPRLAPRRRSWRCAPPSAAGIFARRSMRCFRVRIRSKSPATVERAAPKRLMSVTGQGRERAIRRIDKSQRIGVLRLGGERRQMLPGRSREIRMRSHSGKGVDRGLDIFPPRSSGHPGPRRPWARASSAISGIFNRAQALTAWRLISAAGTDGSASITCVMPSRVMNFAQGRPRPPKPPVPDRQRLRDGALRPPGNRNRRR